MRMKPGPVMVQCLAAQLPLKLSHTVKEEKVIASHLPSGEKLNQTDGNDYLPHPLVLKWQPEAKSIDHPCRLTFCTLLLKNRFFLTTRKREKVYSIVHKVIRRNLMPFLCITTLQYVPKILFTQATIDCLTNNKTKNADRQNETAILN